PPPACSAEGTPPPCERRGKPDRRREEGRREAGTPRRRPGSARPACRRERRRRARRPHQAEGNAQNHDGASELQPRWKGTPSPYRDLAADAVPAASATTSTPTPSRTALRRAHAASPLRCITSPSTDPSDLRRSRTTSTTSTTLKRRIRTILQMLQVIRSRSPSLGTSTPWTEVRMRSDGQWL
ncbi:unnamed protein product, partial [Urochloa humidicola]